MEPPLSSVLVCLSSLLSGSLSILLALSQGRALEELSLPAILVPCPQLPALFPAGSRGSDGRVHLQCRRRGFDPWVGKISWRRKWYPSPVFLPGESHGQRSLVGCSTWGCKESDTTERLNTCLAESQEKSGWSWVRSRGRKTFPRHSQGRGLGTSLSGSPQLRPLLRGLTCISNEQVSNPLSVLLPSLAGGGWITLP